MNEDLQKKYPFLSSFEIDILYLIIKSEIDYKNISNLGKYELILYIKKYVKYICRNNKKILYNEVVKSENLHVNTLFLFRYKKIRLMKIFKLLSKIKDINIYNKPNHDDILRKIYISILIKKIISIIMIVLSFSCVIFSLLNLVNWDKENEKIETMSKKIVSKVKIEEVKPKEEEIIVDDYFKYLNISMLDVDLNNLIKQNSDTKGWIKVNGTNVNYPFVQTSNNDYYLTHSFDNSYNKKGWVFLDYRNNIDSLSKNTILYAHGLVNNAMFGSLRNIIKKDWYQIKENRIINISTDKENMLWEVFSTYTIEPESYYITTDFGSNEEYIEFLNTLKKRSVYNYGVNLNENDKVLTLSSCYNSRKRMVLHAKLVAVSKK